MKPKITDTHPDVERLQLELLREATAARRAQLALSLSRDAIQLARRAIKRANPNASDVEVGWLFVLVHYGREVAERLHATPYQEREMSEPSMADALAPMVEVLEQLGVLYHIGGSVASSLYGIPRTTIDVDVIANLQLEQVDSLVEQLQGDYYVDADMIRDALRRRGSFNIIHQSTMLKIDVFTPKGQPLERQEAERVRLDTLSPTDSRLFYLASPEDVILRKLEWYRAGGEVSERQWGDVLGVLKVQGASLDFDYMRHWSAELGVEDLLRQALEDEGL